MKKHPLLAITLVATGSLWICALWFTMTYASGMAALGGASTSGNMSVPVIVTPYAVFFLSGFLASLTVRRRSRVIGCWVAHTAPAFSLLGSFRDWTFLAAILGITFFVFSPTWFTLLRQHSAEEKEPNQPLQRNASTGSVSNFESPARRG